MSNYLRIAAVNLKHNTFPHLMLALVITLITPAAFGISSLDPRESAQPLEMFLSLTGTALLTPVFMPEQNENIRSLVRSKRTDYLSVCLIRTAYSVAFLAVIFGVFAVIFGVFTVIMHSCESDVTVRHFIGGFASAVFLGSLGFFFSGAAGSCTAGYMVSIMYYICNFMLKDDLKSLYLFSMSSGSFEEKYFLLLCSAVLLALTFASVGFLQKRGIGI